MIEGDNVQALFKHESGGHRFQRVPESEKRGRMQTSTITVAVLDVPGDNSNICQKDVEYRATNLGGPGGQHRNRTMSDIIAIHIPSGIQATACGRNQHENKENAFQILSSKVFEYENNSMIKKQNLERKAQIGTGQRGDKVRTIKMQDNRVKCERTGRVKSYKDYEKGNIWF